MRLQRLTPTAPSVLLDHCLPASRPSANLWLTRCAVLLIGALLIAFSARLAFPLPFSPIPVTAQTLAVLVLAAALGSRMGAATVMTYLIMGAGGLPVGAGSASGPAWLFGASAGYLLGFVIAAALVGLLAERGWDRRIGTTLLAMLLGHAVILTLGWAWLTFPMGVSAAFMAGVLPFLPGMVIKSVAGIALLPAAWALLHRE